jgi:hypothetical protein
VFSLTNVNTTNNYGYDGEGRLVRDDAEEIASIKWTVTGKVKEVNRTSGSTKKNLKFRYDAMGQRIAKEVYDSQNNWEKTTFYVRDPQGNVMAIYDKTTNAQSQQISYKVVERDMYGSSRVGLNTIEVEMIGATTGGSVSSHVVGKKQYEISNHLGNVLSIVTDKVLSKDWDMDNIVDYFRSEIVNASDYTPFGVQMDGRKFVVDDYRYHFNGMEKDNEIAEGVLTAEFWEYDSRSGRRWNQDPVVKPFRSPYDAFSNSPITRIDPRGDDDYFDKDGRYLGSDGAETNDVRIVTDDAMIAELSEHAGDQSINPDRYRPASTLIADFNYGTNASPSNRSMLAAVATFYAEKVGTTKTVRAEDSKSKTRKASAYFNITEDYYAVAIKDGKISGEFNNAYTFMNILYHEKQHEDDPNTYSPLGHVDANIRQSEHSSWANTPQSHKGNALYYSADLMNQALQEGATKEAVDAKLKEVQASPLMQGGEIFWNDDQTEIIAVPEMSMINIVAPK